jgi:hypothetical protein
MKRNINGKNNPNYRHGEAQGGYTGLYRAWDNMMQRCYNPKNNSFKNYGGRGIVVCDLWKDKTQFFKWAKANGYKNDLEIDRMDNDLGYCPENCRFVTLQINLLNKQKKPLRGIYPVRNGFFEIAFTRFGKRYYCGRASNLEDAIKKRDNEEKRINEITIHSLL